MEGKKHVFFNSSINISKDTPRIKGVKAKERTQKNERKYEKKNIIIVQRIAHISVLIIYYTYKFKML